MGIKNLIRRWLLGDTREVGDIPMRNSPVTIDGPTTATTRTFTITEALNGSYITFQRRKYNPHSADEYCNEVYLVQPGESLIDAISTVLVLTER